MFMQRSNLQFFILSFVNRMWGRGGRGESGGGVKALAAGNAAAEKVEVKTAAAEDVVIIFTSSVQTYLFPFHPFS